MPGKTPHGNGNEPVENGIRSNQDVDMKEKGKTKKSTKEGDEEMTVVVPPTRPVKSSAPPPDSDGDVAMDVDTDKADDGEVKVDPVLQTATGKLQAVSGGIAMDSQTILTIMCRN
jgi:26S proteasome regulatory subunit N3